MNANLTCQNRTSTFLPFAHAPGSGLASYTRIDRKSYNEPTTQQPAFIKPKRTSDEREPISNDKGYLSFGFTLL